MLETIKKSILTGIGMALRSKAEIEEMAKEFAQNAEMNQAEAKEFLNEIRTKYDEARSDFDKKLETAVETVLKKLDLPTRSDIRELNSRIDELAEKLDKNS